MASAARLNKEKKELSANNYILLEVSDTLWNISLAGPEGSPFEGGQFMVEFKLEGFPFKPPVIAVKTKIFHPNIDEKGLVCEDMLETGSKWAPTKKLCAVMDKLKSMLVAPSSDNALNPDCAKVFTTDRAKWFSEAQKWTQQYAK